MKNTDTSTVSLNAKNPAGEIHAVQQAVAYAPEAAMSVEEFCRRHDISKGLFYKLVKQGRGPRLMKAGKRTLVSVSAASEWIKKMETPT